VEAEGYVVAAASNGQEALEYLRSQTFPPDLIVLDLMMPIMDGFQFRKSQRKECRAFDLFEVRRQRMA
jgi:CheY-like chemotaxis protein